MSFHERSLDDLPLAAYTSGVVPNEDEELDLAGDPGYTSVPAPSTATADMQHSQAAEADRAAPDVPAAKRRRFSLRLPALRRSKAAALQHAAPFQPVNQPEAAPGAYQAAAGAYQAGSGAFQAVHGFDDPVPVRAATPPAREGAAPRDPRALLRDPRILAGGTIAVGLVLLGISLLGGGGPTSGTAGPNSSQGAGGVQPSAAPAGIASVELTGGLTNLGIYALAGAKGAGPAVDSHLDAIWTDPLGQNLGLVGLASQGTRTTDANFVLSWTMLIDNLPVTFTSRNSECTIGMAVGAKAVHGTFVCKKLPSTDGSQVIDLKGTYTT